MSRNSSEYFTDKRFKNLTFTAVHNKFYASVETATKTNAKTSFSNPLFTSNRE